MEKFIKFLEDNNALENFERAFENHGRDAEEYKKNCEDNINIELSSAFPWACTDQGFIYWERLDAKWRQVNNTFKGQLLCDD